MQMNKGTDEQRLSEWTQQLHDKLADYETPAPADLWADIETALPPDSGQRFPALQPDGSGQRFQALQSRKARLVSLRRWAAAAAVAVVLAGGGLVWWSLDNQQAEPLISMAEDTAEDSVLDAPVYEEYDDEQNETAPLSTPEQSLTTSRRSKGEATHEEVQESLSQSEETTVERPQSEETTVDQPKTEETNVDRPQSEETTVDQPQHKATEAGQSQYEKPAIVHRPRLNRQPSLGLYAMNGFSTKDNSNGVMMADALAKNYANTFAAGQAASRQAPIFLTGYEEREHHYQPISFGLTVSYPLNDRLSLTSGVVYTQLKSEFTQVIHSQQINKEQTLHYVGIPLSVNYRLWQYKGFMAYLSAGMQADWNIKAQLKSEGVEQEIDPDCLQWSANGSLGLQYNVLPQLSLYAEPGINHYFNNGSPVENFFKDKPTSLKLQVGVRLNLSAGR